MQTGAAGIKLPTFSRLFDDLLSAVTICVIELCNVCLSGFKLPSFKLIFFFNINICVKRLAGAISS